MLKWYVRVDGKRVMTTTNSCEATNRALREWAKSDRKSLVQIFSRGPLRKEILVEEWGIEK